MSSTVAAVAAVTAPENPPASADSQLMGRVRDGEVALLGELFERHHQRLFHFFLRLARSRQAAEDLVQEVFVRMLKYRHTFRSESEFVPWMFTLARNAATDLYRARPKELPQEPDAPEPAADLPHPIAGLERAEQAGKLRRALARLDPAKREILLLARFSELKYDRIAAQYGISEGAVKVRVHRAMKELRAAFLADGATQGLQTGEAG
ncbi:MAG: sigma-70 family RNA polymerase sigma factor [Thermoanaerobaculia bacterium]